MLLHRFANIALVSLLLVSWLPSPGVARQPPAASERVAEQDETLSLLPVPAKIVRQPGYLSFDRSIPVSWVDHVDSRLERAIARWRAALPTTPVPRPGARPKQRPAPEPALLLEVAGPGEEVQSWREDESYRLRITESAIRVEAATAVGAMRGLATLRQLIEADNSGLRAPRVEVEDRPRFPWRGLLIDVCRHWIPPATIERNLDAMEASKLNVLHLHLTEDQAFRVESKVFPKLHQLGSDGNYYRQEELRTIVRLARDRGIRVVPEIDMPGHTTSSLVGYPALAGEVGPSRLATRYGVQDAALDPTLESTYDFIDRLLEEMVELFPDEYLHVGGDEVNGRFWQDSPTIRRFMAERGMENTEDLQLHFNRRLGSIVAGHGKQMAGWDEILHPALPPDSLIQSWRGAQSLAEAVSKGHPAILSSGYYLDLMHSAERHYGIAPAVSNPDLDSEADARILGGEACMWTELADADNLDSRIWPRALAIAERLWSPASVADVDDLYRRMAKIDQQLEDLGLEHRSAPRRRLLELAGEDRIEALAALAEAVEPLEDYRRHGSRRYTTLTPLNRFVDLVAPESLAARGFSRSVERFLAGDSARSEQIVAQLRAWRSSHESLAGWIPRVQRIAEIAPLSQALYHVASIGLEALDQLSGESQDFDAIIATRSLDRLSRPVAELELVIVAPIRNLVAAAESR